MKQLIGLLVVMPFFLAGCVNGIVGKGQVLTKQYAFEPFTSVDYRFPGKVYFEQGAQSVSVKTNENLFDYFEFEVKRGVLSLKLQDGYSIMDYDEFEVHVSIPVLERFDLDGSGDLISFKPIVLEKNLELKIDGSGDMQIKDLQCQDLNMEIDGSGELKIDAIAGKRLECNIDGSGDITIAGSGKKFEVDIDGSGDVIASEVKVDDGDVDINGSGSCYIWATDDLNVRINGSGSVYYKGNPDLDTEINGSGKTQRL